MGSFLAELRQQQMIYKKYEADFKGEFKAYTTFKKCYAGRKYCISLHFTNNLIWHNTAEMKQ